VKNEEGLICRLATFVKQQCRANAYFTDPHQPFFYLHFPDIHLIPYLKRIVKYILEPFPYCLVIAMIYLDQVKRNQSKRQGVGIRE